MGTSKRSLRGQRANLPLGWALHHRVYDYIGIYGCLLPSQPTSHTALLTNPNKDSCTCMKANELPHFGARPFTLDRIWSLTHLEKIVRLVHNARSSRAMIVDPQRCVASIAPSNSEVFFPQAHPSGAVFPAEAYACESSPVGPNVDAFKPPKPRHRCFWYPVFAATS